MNVRVGCLVVMMMCGLLGAACRKSSPVSPSAAFGGTWSGSAVETTTGAAPSSGTARLQLDQNGLAVSGTITTTFGGTTTRDGSVVGTVVGNVASLGYNPGAPLDCGGGLILSRVVVMTLTVAGPTLTGIYSSFTCGGAVSGTLSLTKQ